MKYLIELIAGIIMGIWVGYGSFNIVKYSEVRKKLMLWIKRFFRKKRD